MRLTSAIPIFAAVFLPFAASQAHAQDPQPESSSKPAEAPSPAPPKSRAKQKKDTATQNAPDQPAWDPLRAEKDLEVGQYYMKKGDLDAAIDRFQDATAAKPGSAIPFRYLAEAQEKKGLKKQAIKSYQRYLDLYPHAEDGDKMRKKIDKLYKDIQREKK
ncbi:MAG TPA: tetratricopeptide repeat protein [Candidatus Limnocylindria bacterium]|jgi:tetratricopeptide (TPR) repeat protein|nr:tetratricopeptide repeat protein [Candidatus Limnocylindria bacterium]